MTTRSPTHQLILLTCQQCLSFKYMYSTFWFVIFKKLYIFIYGFSGSLLLCLDLSFLSCGEWGLLFVAVCGLLIAVASRCGAQALGTRTSVVVDCRLYSVGSVIVAHGHSCSTACGIFLYQGSKPCLMHWQEDSYQLHHQGSPYLLIFK